MKTKIFPERRVLGVSTEFELEGGGKIRIWEDSGRVFFRCERSLSRDGIYKVWICGDRGDMLLGTLVPEGERLVLGRTVWQMELLRCGCWPVRGGRCRLAVPFGARQTDGWYWEEDPARLVDRETARLGEWRRMLARRTDNGVELAAPWHREEPIPLSALFCLAWTENIQGETCLVWKFDQHGKPCLPVTRHCGEESRAR